MTERQVDTSAQIRELSVEDTHAVSGGIDLHNYVMVHRYVSPLDIHSFNPQPDPPARVLAAAAVG